MSRSNLSHRGRRRGQALLLAVLIMIFAALLSAAFIGIVAVNLNQTARLTDKNRAYDSAKAGLDFVNRQLAYSPEGEQWFTATAAPINLSLQNATARKAYYSPLDVAQGWDQNYIKFPDPRSDYGDYSKGPQFLVNVRRIDFNLPSNDPEFDKSGALKITVIGLSSEDPTAYHRIVAYKGGIQRSPIAQTMRVVSNYDFKTENVLVAQANPTSTTNNGTGTPPLLSVTRARGDFSRLGTPFTITVSDPRPRAGFAPSPVNAEGAVVTSVTRVSATEFNLTLAQPLTAAPAVTARVELAANIGAPTGIDYDNTNTPVSLASSAGNFRLSDGPTGNNTEQVDGGRFNGGLLWSGELLAQKLRAFNNSYTSIVAPPGTIKASGAIALDRTGTSSVAIANTTGTVTDNLVASSDLANGIFATSLTTDKDQLVSDGWNRLKGITPTNANGTVRAVSDFIPPAIDSGPGYDRYRNLARYSQSIANSTGSVPAQTNGALYGYGRGIYIDNAQDREKIYDATLVPPALREMTQTELTQLWMSQLPGTPTTFPDYFRNGVPTATTDPNYNNVSLEQKHLRGWVGPDEFRARGVEIELGAGILTITRDSRDDANPLGASPAQVWKTPANPNGVTGKYTETMVWPANGVVFAEGNVRIKGVATLVATSLTVVSMGNIYIEGDLQITPSATVAPKILLLAKKNVVMNPTRVLSQADNETTSSNNAQTISLGTANVTVVSALGFKAGDFVQGTTVQGYVTGVPTETTLPLNVITAGTIAAGERLFTPTASIETVTSASSGKNLPFTTISRGTEAIQRRLFLPANYPAGIVNDLRLAFNHQGNRVNGLTVSTETNPGKQPYLGPIYFANKGFFRNPVVAPYLDNTKVTS
jgi:hypothetical protein